MTQSYLVEHIRVALGEVGDDYIGPQDALPYIGHHHSCAEDVITAGQRKIAAPMLSMVRQSPETTESHLEPPRIVCRLSVVRPSGSGDPSALFWGSKEPRFRSQSSVVYQSFCRRKAPQ